MIPTYIFGSLFILCAIVVAYRIIRCAKRGRDWPDDYPDGWG
jgi:hypothetical protein